MRQRALALLCAAAVSIPCAAHAGWVDSVKGFFSQNHSTQSALVKVLIAHDVPGAVIDIRGKYKVYDPLTREQISHRHMGKKQYLQTFGDGLKWGEEFPGVHQLLFVPDDVHAGFFIDGKHYQGALYVYDIGKSISLVNELPIEDYLSAVLTPSFPENSHFEVLAAVAIAARTQTYYALQHPKNRFWHVDGKRVGYEGTSSSANANMAKALQITKDMVLSRTGPYDGVITPIPALWGSTTGGKPQNEEVVFAHITLHEAESLANRGENAAKILKKAFPGSTVEIINR